LRPAAAGWRRRCLDDRGAAEPGREFRFREVLQLELRRRRIGCNSDLFGELLETDHFDLELPDAIGQIGKRERSALIAGGRDLLFALHNSDGDARNG